MNQDEWHDILIVNGEVYEDIEVEMFKGQIKRFRKYPHAFSDRDVCAAYNRRFGKMRTSKRRTMRTH